MKRYMFNSDDSVPQYMPDMSNEYPFSPNKIGYRKLAWDSSGWEIEQHDGNEQWRIIGAMVYEDDIEDAGEMQYIVHISQRAHLDQTVDCEIYEYSAIGTTEWSVQASGADIRSAVALAQERVILYLTYDAAWGEEILQAALHALWAAEHNALEKLHDREDTPQPKEENQ